MVSRRGGSRPVGTDGADHQYRMVIEDRYKLIASSKALLKRLFLFQGLFLTLRGLLIVLSRGEDGPLPQINVSLSVVGGVALLAGTIGLHFSSAPILRLYLVLTVASFGVTLANMLEAPYAQKMKGAVRRGKFDADAVVKSLGDPMALLDVVGLIVLGLAVYTTLNLVYALRAGRKKAA